MSHMQFRKIKAKHPNLALLNFIVESKLKHLAKKALNEISDTKPITETKRSMYLAQIDSIRNKINSEAEKFMKLLEASRAICIIKLNDIEQYLKDQNKNYVNQIKLVDWKKYPLVKICLMKKN